MLDRRVLRGAARDVARHRFKRERLPLPAEILSTVPGALDEGDLHSMMLSRSRKGSMAPETSRSKYFIETFGPSKCPESWFSFVMYYPVRGLMYDGVECTLCCVMQRGTALSEYAGVCRSGGESCDRLVYPHEAELTAICCERCMSTTSNPRPCAKTGCSVPCLLSVGGGQK